MNDCPRFQYLIGSCKFEPRYDRIPPERIGHLDTTVGGAEVLFKAMTKEVYVGDVCVRCGKTVKRPA